jgi:hypothetical protein
MHSKFFNSKWFERIFTATLSIILLLITQRFTAVRDSKAKESDDKSRIEAEINSRATILYVDAKNKETKEECQREIINTKIDLNKIITTFSEDMNDVRSDVHEIRNFIFSRKLSKLDTIRRIEPIGITKIESSLLEQSEKLNLSMLVYDKKYQLTIR